MATEDNLSKPASHNKLCIVLLQILIAKNNVCLQLIAELKGTLRICVLSPKTINLYIHAIH